jgi:hypothetical protein
MSLLYEATRSPRQAMSMTKKNHPLIASAMSGCKSEPILFNAQEEKQEEETRPMAPQLPAGRISNLMMPQSEEHSTSPLHTARVQLGFNRSKSCYSMVMPTAYDGGNNSLQKACWRGACCSERLSSSSDSPRSSDRHGNSNDNRSIAEDVSGVAAVNESDERIVGAMRRREPSLPKHQLLVLQQLRALIAEETSLNPSIYIESAPNSARSVGSFGTRLSRPAHTSSRYVPFPQTSSLSGCGPKNQSPSPSSSPLLTNSRRIVKEVFHAGHYECICLPTPTHSLSPSLRSSVSDLTRIGSADSSVFNTWGSPEKAPMSARTGGQEHRCDDLDENLDRVLQIVTNQPETKNILFV